MNERGTNQRQVVVQNTRIGGLAASSPNYRQGPRARSTVPRRCRQGNAGLNPQLSPLLMMYMMYGY